MTRNKKGLITVGFVGKFFKTIFDPEIPQAQVLQPEISGKELLSSTSSAEPEAPVMGAKNTSKGGGVSSLLVPSESLYKTQRR